MAMPPLLLSLHRVAAAVTTSGHWLKRAKVREAVGGDFMFLQTPGGSGGPWTGCSERGMYCINHHENCGPVEGLVKRYVSGTISTWMWKLFIGMVPVL